MPITVTVEKAQANLYKYLNQLDAGAIDKIIVQDASANLFQMVTAAVYEAADPASSAVAEIDVVVSYSGSPGAQTKSLYRMIKNMRDKQAGGDASVAQGTITCVAKALMVDTETMALTDAAGVGYTLEFDTGGGVTTGNVAVDISGDTTADEVATTLAAVIDGLVFTAPVPAANVITVTQSDPGTGGNATITDTVANTGFVTTGFAGGTNAEAAGGVVGLKNSKNDASIRAYMVPEDHAVAIGL